MKNVVNTYLEKFMRERRMRRRLICVLLVLAAVVGTGVYWQLRMTGAALTNEVYCGKTEHTHDNSCYETVLVCGLEEGEGTAGHTHTEECYETVTTLICGLEESEGHTHTDACYTKTLTCTLEESEGHAHTDSCYDEEGSLICGLEESAGHTHTDSCYTLELTCGLEESEGHTHTDACYQTEQVLICELEECESETGHTHTDACYEKQLVCGLEEHTHTVECLIDESADTETASVWEATIPTTLSGVWADDLVAAAKSQLGYTESTANFKLADDGETRQGYTRYGAWAGNECGDWDAMFVSFCLHYAGISQEDFPEATGAYAWSVTLKNMGLFIEASEATFSADALTDISDTTSADSSEDESSASTDSSETSGDVSENVSEDVSAEETTDVADILITAGDLIFYDTDDDDKIDRVGIVISIDEENSKLTVIEGDYAENEDDTDAVCTVEYSINDERIVGYGSLPEQEEEAVTGTGAGSETGSESESESEIESESETETENKGISLSSEGEDYTVVVTYGEDAGIPEDAVLVVEEYDSNSEQYQSAYAEAAVLYGWNDTDEVLDVEENEAAEETEVAAEISDAEEAEDIVDAADTDVTDTDGTESIAAITSIDVTEAETEVEAEAADAGIGAGSEFRLFSIGLYADGEKLELTSQGSVTFTFHNRESSVSYEVTEYGAQDGKAAVTDFSSEYNEESGDQILQFAMKDGFYYAISSTVDEEDEKTEDERMTLTFEGEDYVVTVVYGEDAEFPDNVELIVSEYAQDSDAYQSRYAEAAALYGWDSAITEVEAGSAVQVTQTSDTGSTAAESDSNETSETSETGTSETGSAAETGTAAETSETAETGENGAENTIDENSAEETSDHEFRLFNIGFYVDGEKIEPAAAVTVTISYLGKDGMETYTVTHFGEEDTQNIDATSEYEDGSQTQTITFDADGFSDYGIASSSVTDVGSFYLWIYDSNGIQVAGYSQWVTATGSNFSTSGITDVLKYTDSSSVTWYLIPVSYFESALEDDGYVFYESKTDTCPFYYVPNATTTASAGNASGAAAYFSVTDGTDTSWYVGVQDTGSYTNPNYPRSNIFYIPSVDSVVLNLGNGNGKYSFAGYVGGTGKTGTGALRYQIDDLSGYADASTGLVTIHLPGDDDINSSDVFTVVEAVGSNDAKTVSLSPESQYEYKLVGWINIATGEYYDVSNGSVTATVDLENSNVFYADWIANSYDHGDQTGSATLVDTADTSSFVTIRMFDYNELFNLYSTSLSQTSVTSETWTITDYMYEELVLSNATSTLTAVDDALVFFSTELALEQKLLERPSGRANQNLWTNNAPVSNKYLPYQGIVSSVSDTILTRLFDTTGSTLGVTYVGEANYLFSYDDTTGYYSYDSDSNAAVYNQSQKRFYVYTDKMHLGATANGGFLPYNDYTGSTYSKSDGSVNYWFGMNVELDFYLPNDAGSTNANKINGEDMVFEFSGDDDIWIFIDGELVLDMGGIHSQTEGKINFSTGEVTIADGTTYEISKTFTCTAGAHTMTIYYMERGASDSNMKITFNIFPSWQYASADAGTMKVTKVWEDSEATHQTITVGLFEQIASSSYIVSGSTYTYNSVDYKVDSDGYSYDNSTGMVNAYYKEGYLYVLVDTQTLDDNNLTYTWELLDESKTYEILELTTLTNYITPRNCPPASYPSCHRSTEPVPQQPALSL